MDFEKKGVSMKERLLILLNNHVIDQDVYDNCIRVYENLIIKNGYSDEQSSVFITHLAMMLQRNKNGEVVSKMEDFIINEIKSTLNFQDVKDFSEKVYKLLDFEIPEIEKDYILLHLSNFVK